MPYERRGKCVYKKDTGKKKGCSDSVEKTKKYLNKLRMVEEEQNLFSLDREIEEYLAEAAKDAKVLRKINIDLIKKEIPKEPDEETRDYFLRLQALEKDPERDIGAFPVALVDWIEQLTDDYFPRDGRKRFAKWLGNAIWHEEMEVKRKPVGFDDLEIYENDIRYIVDYLNGAGAGLEEIWSLTFEQMIHAAEEWHETLKGVEATGEYGTKKVVYNFENGFTMVEVPAEDLETEGEYMGHCVGTYCDAVYSGAKSIYSLRDAKNRPHATIEVVDSQMRHGHESAIQQIKGKGNAAPAEKYRPMIKQWLKSTNFEFHENRDYWNMLSEEELMEMVTSGEASYRLINDLARTTKSPQILDFFVDAVTDPDQEAIRAMNNANRGSLLVSLAHSKSLSEAQVLKIIEVDLEIGVLDYAVEDLFSVTHAEFEETRPDGTALAPVVWEKFRGKLTQNVDEIKLGYLSAIVKHSDDEALSREIVNLLLDDEALNALVKPKKNVPYDTSLTAEGRSSDRYTDLLQSYLLHNKNPDRETLVRIFKFTRTLKGEILAGSHTMDSYVAKSLSITPGIIEDMLSDKLDPVGLSTKKNLILNPSVEEKYKYGILKKMMNRDAYDRRGGGYPIVKQIGRLMWRDKQIVDPGTFDVAPSGLFSEKFMLWCLDAGVFDGVIEDEARQAPAGHPVRGETPAQSREQIKRQILNLFKVSADPPEEPQVTENVVKKFKLIYSTLNLQEDIENYLELGGQYGNDND